jgi:hypothetical protein
MTLARGRLIVLLAVAVGDEVFGSRLHSIRRTSTDTPAHSVSSFDPWATECTSTVIVSDDRAVNSFEYTSGIG